MAVEEIGRLRSIAIVGQGGDRQNRVGRGDAVYRRHDSAGGAARRRHGRNGLRARRAASENLDQLRLSSLQLEKRRGRSWPTRRVIRRFCPNAFATMRAVDGLVFVATAGGDLKVEARKNMGRDEPARCCRGSPSSRGWTANVTSFDRGDGGSREDAGRASGRADPADRCRAQAAFNGVIDVLAMKALIYAEASGKPREEALNAEHEGTRRKARTRLCEAVAETDDALLEKYLEQGACSEDDELRAALRKRPPSRASSRRCLRIGAQEYRHRTAARRDRRADARRPTCGPRVQGLGRRQRRRRSNVAPDPAAPFSALRLQDRDRSVRRQAVDFSRGVGTRPKRRDVLNSTRGVARALRPAAAPGGQEAIADLSRAAG